MGSRSHQVLGNALVLLIVAAASGVLAALLAGPDVSVLTGWLSGGPANRAEDVAHTPVPVEPQTAEPAPAPAPEASSGAEQGREEAGTPKAHADAAAELNSGEARPADVAATEERQDRARERQVVDILSRNLAAARDEVILLKAGLAAGEAERLKLSEDIQNAHAVAAEHKRALEQERDKAAALTLALESTRQQVEHLSAEAARAQAELAKHKRALEQERENAATVALDLDSTRDQVEHLTAEAARAQTELAEHKQALDRERKRAFILEPPVVVLGTPIPVKTTPVPAVPQPKLPPAPAQPGAGPTKPADAATTKR
jgi:hypothetical protein